MILRDLDLNKLSRLASQHVDHVTCVECCKYYTVPTTASCGHTLCHSCWRGRRNCASCSIPIEKKNLKLNIPLQNLTEHVSTLSETFEDLFKIKLDEYLFDSPTDNFSNDPNKNVNDWLASSQNQFSAPITKSTHSTQGQIITEQITSDIQVHTENRRVLNPIEVVHVPHQQDDWDIIEEMADTENNVNKNQENVVGPMDLESFEFMMDDEYTSHNPRRSSRQKENKVGNSMGKQEASPERASCGDSNKDSENKFLKVAKNWNNVKRMKKEFSKLNKKNRNKLNVSIEMCKKTQNTNKLVPTISQGKLYAIDDNTPENINNDRNEEPVINNDKIDEGNECVKDQVNICNNSLKTNNGKGCKANAGVRDEINQVADVQKTAFIKKGILHKPSVIKDDIEIVTDKPSTDLTINNDDIEITIKIGNTLTNICIRKKDNDVQLKINSDREVQTSVENFNNNKKDVSTSPIAVNNIKCIRNDDNIVNTPSTFKGIEAEKSISKKNTASADTATAPFEITKSIEEEMIQSIDINASGKKNTQRINKNVLQEIRSQSQALNKISEFPEEFLKFSDIYDSDSVKEGSVVTLKSAKNTPSAIMPSIRTAKFTTPTNDKRNRDKDDVCDLPISKKMKLTPHKEFTSTLEFKEKGNVVENGMIVNDDIFCQVLDHIDVMQNSKTDMKETKASQDNELFNKSSSQISFVNNSTSTKPSKEKPNEEYSFSFLENDAQILKTLNYKTQVQTQQDKNDIDKGTNKSRTATDLGVMELCTPVEDDSDKSVVEDTPQKSTSFSKMRNKNESTNNINTTVKPNLTTEQVNNVQQNVDADVISLSDTVGESAELRESVTVIEKRKAALAQAETPLTITKFVDQIKHKSTPVARKSLNFNNENCNPDVTVYPSSFVLAKTTQEKEFLSRAFERTLETESVRDRIVLKFVIAGSCLTAAEQARVRLLCSQRDWMYVEKYTKKLTHLVVGVDEENKSQRSVKYMCALAGGKWIISYEWIEKCLDTDDVVDEEQFEALDGTGEPGPRRSRLAKQKLFAGISFHCMPPFSVLDVDILEDILRSSGGSVVRDAAAARASASPSLLLAEPEHTQEDRFIYLAMELCVVPINYEWVLNCLGSYTLGSIYELLLCPASLLPPVVSKWPAELVSHDE